MMRQINVLRHKGRLSLDTMEQIWERKGWQPKQQNMQA